jgi:hypothetical protein
LGLALDHEKEQFKAPQHSQKLWRIITLSWLLRSPLNTGADLESMASTMHDPARSYVSIRAEKSIIHPMTI